MAKIEHRFITPCHPRANGVADRYIAISKLTIAKYIQGDVSTWDEHVSSGQYVLNTEIAALHNSTPFSLFFGRQLYNASNAEEQNLHSVLMSEEDLLKAVDYLT
jgi:hypothetical protein